MSAFLTPGMSAGTLDRISAVWHCRYLACPSSHPFSNKGNGLWVPYPTDIPNSQCQWDPVGFPLGSFPVYLGTVFLPENTGTPTSLCSPPPEPLPCSGSRCRALSCCLCPIAIGRCSAPPPRAAVPRCPPVPPVPPTAPFHRQLQRSPSSRRCRRRDRWCPRRHTCLGFILAPNLHYFTRQPAPGPCHPHAAPWGGPKTPEPQPSRSRARAPPASATPQPWPQVKVTFAWKQLPPKSPARLPRSPRLCHPAQRCGNPRSAVNPSLLPGSKYTQPAPHSLSFISTQFYILFCLFLSYIEIHLDLLLPWFWFVF